MTTSEAAPTQTGPEAVAELFGISLDDARLLYTDPYTRGVIENNFRVKDSEADTFKDVDPVEFIQGRLESIKSEHATEQEIEDAMAQNSHPSRDGDNNL